MIKKYITKFILILFFIPQYSLVFANLNDSIPDFVKNIKDTAQITQLLDHAKKIKRTDKDSAETLLRLAEYASNSIGDEKKIIESVYEYALFLFLTGKHDRAFKKFQFVMNNAGKLGIEKYYYWAKVYIGTIYMVKSNYNIATDYNLEGLKYFESKKDYSAVSGILLNLTYIQIEQNDRSKAEEYADLSYEYAVLADHDMYKSKSLLNIGEMAYRRSEFNKSLSYYKQSLAIAQKIDFESFYSVLYLNIGSNYLALNEHDSALYYGKLVINKTVLSDADLYSVPKGYLLMSEVYEAKKDFKKAVEYSLSALKFADSVKIHQISAMSYEYLSRLYSKLGYYKEALDSKLKASTIFDSIFTEEKYIIQNNLEAIYETAKKEKEIEMLSKENEIVELKNQKFRLFIYLSSLFVFIAALIAFLIVRQNKISIKHRTIEVEQKLLRSQMNPHFIFNSVSSIQDFIMNNEPLEASSYLSDFAKLMRAILNNSTDNFITIEQDIKTNKHYLRLQHLRMSDKFSYEINCAEQLDSDENLVPPMLLQPFIENSIKHGINSKVDGSGLITVNYFEDKGYIIIECEDNGPGRKKTVSIGNEEHRSMAVDITKQRIKLLSKEYDHHIQFHIFDLTDDDGNPSGTKVQFKLPVKYI